MSQQTHNVVTYSSAAGAVIAGLTLNEIAAVIGIIAALGTMGFNFYFAWRRDRRERREFEYRTGVREDRRRNLECIVDCERRVQKGAQ